MGVSVHVCSISIVKLLLKVTFKRSPFLYLAFQFTNLANGTAKRLQLMEDVEQNAGRYKFATN